MNLYLCAPLLQQRTEKWCKILNIVEYCILPCEWRTQSRYYSLLFLPSLPQFNNNKQNSILFIYFVLIKVILLWLFNVFHVGCLFAIFGWNMRVWAFFPLLVKIGQENRNEIMSDVEFGSHINVKFQRKKSIFVNNNHFCCDAIFPCASGYN